MENLKATFPLVYNDRRSTISIQPVAEQQDGYLKYDDWKEFKEKVATDKTIYTKAPLYGGGDLTINREIYISQADSNTDGYLLSEDYRDFKSKYPFPKGLNNQYIKGDGSIGNYVRHTETSTASITYFLNAQGNGVIGSTTYYRLGLIPSETEKVFTIAEKDDVICSFISDIGSPNQTIIPKGRWSLDIFASTTKQNDACIYIELCKFSNGSIINITQSKDIRLTNVNCDIYTIPIDINQEISLLKEERIAIKILSRNVGGNRINIYSGGQLRTNISNGITSLNGITASIQDFKFRADGSDVSIKSEGYTHYFNIPTASGNSRGLLSPNDFNKFEAKQDKIEPGSISESNSEVLNIKNADKSTLSNVTIEVKRACDEQSGYLHYTDYLRFGGKVSTNRNIKVSLPLIGGGDFSQDRIIAINRCDKTNDGYLSKEDYIKFDGKQDKIVGAVTTILNEDLPISKVVVTNGIGKLVTSSISTNDLNTLSGIRDNIQSQINDKSPILSPSFRGNPEAPTQPERSNNDLIATTAYVDRRASFIPFSLGTIISSFSPADNTTYYFGSFGNPYSLTPHTRFIPVPSACMVKDIALELIVGGIVPSKEVISLYVCTYDINNYLLGTHLISDRITLNNQYRTNKYHFKNLNLHIKAGSFIVFKMVVDSFAINPTQVYGAGTMSII